MNNPKSEDVLKVIEAFEEVLPLANERDNHLCMAEVRIAGYEHECGTVHCHAGWYGVAMVKHGRLEESGKHGIYVSFSDGGMMMAEDLGFTDDGKSLYSPLHTMARWAGANPDIWGNPYGRHMFSGEKAFESKDRPKGAENLQHIIDHWKEVYERLRVLEGKKREDITSQLAILPVEETLDTIKTQEYAKV